MRSQPEQAPPTPGLGRLTDFVHRNRRAIASVIYSVIAASSLALAYLARWEFDPAVLKSWEFTAALSLLVLVRLGVNYFFRLGMSRWRFVGLPDLLRLLGAETAGSIVFWALTWGLPFIPAVPRSIILLEWLFNGYLTGGMWIVYRLLYEHFRGRSGGARTRVLVVGAGEAGQQLVHQMRRSGVGWEPLGIVDDDPFKWGTLIHGVEVIGSVEDVSPIARNAGAEEILIAVPSASPGELRRIIEACEDSELPLKILPGMEDVLTGKADLASVRKVEVEDLLGRDPVNLELPQLEEDLRGRTVLITGAAGSIGSELVRQVALHRPRQIVLLDQAETPLYYLELDIRDAHPDLSLRCVVGSVTNPKTLRRLFAECKPHRVFHAAAYKHVPMMEHNAAAAAQTNVLGTYLVARTSGESGVESFVLVSTDKAVRPVNIMGATKFLAEKVVLRLQQEYSGTAFGAVRFGNVLGSNGSVIPLFRRQLEQGEPLTVTHEEVTRYFMTIPEAVQLILQASLLPDLRGNVAMLEMGTPIRILDLARNLLRLSGQPFRLGKNVVITGLRPGEKLHEELSAPDEEVSRTELERVFLVHPRPVDDLSAEAVWRALEGGDENLILEWLYRTFPDLDRRGVQRRRPDMEIASPA